MDYEKVNGLLIPHYIERLYQPHYVRGYEVTNVEINSEIDVDYLDRQQRFLKNVTIRGNL